VERQDTGRNQRRRTTQFPGKSKLIITMSHLIQHDKTFSLMYSLNLDVNYGGTVV